MNLKIVNYFWRFIQELTKNIDIELSIATRFIILHGTTTGLEKYYVFLIEVNKIVIFRNSDLFIFMKKITSFLTSWKLSLPPIGAEKKHC